MAMSEIWWGRPRGLRAEHAAGWVGGWVGRRSTVCQPAVDWLQLHAPGPAAHDGPAGAGKAQPAPAQLRQAGAVSSTARLATAGQGSWEPNGASEGA